MDIKAEKLGIIQHVAGLNDEGSIAKIKTILNDRSKKTSKH